MTNPVVLKTFKAYKPKLASLMQAAQKARLTAMGTNDKELWAQVNADVRALEEIIEHQHKLMTDTRTEE